MKMKKRSVFERMAEAPYLVWSALFIIAPLLFVVYFAFTDRNGSFTFETPWINVTYNLLFASERYTLAQNLPDYRIKPYTDHGISISRSFKWNKHRLRIQADALNLSNKNYEIIRFYPMPGRNYKLSLTYNY